MTAFPAPQGLGQAALAAPRADQGVDFGRVLAAVGVIIIHARFGPGSSLAPTAMAFCLSWLWVVPFFLTASYFYVWRSLERKTTGAVLPGRLRRLWIPYFIWTVIYFGLRLLIYRARADHEAAAGMISDWPTLLFLGEADVHLYFIPLVSVGLLWFLLAPLCKSLPWLAILPLFGLSCWVDQQLFLALNDFGPAGTGFQHFAPELTSAGHFGNRLAFAFAACAIQTLPYFLAARLLQLTQPLLQSWTRHSIFGWGIFAATWALFSISSKSPITELFAGVGIFAGLLWAGRLPGGARPIAALAKLSAGCYFAHHLFLEAAQIVVKKRWPAVIDHTTLTTILLLSFGAAVATFCFVALCDRLGRCGQTLAATT